MKRILAIVVILFFIIAAVGVGATYYAMRPNAGGSKTGTATADRAPGANQSRTASPGASTDETTAPTPVAKTDAPMYFTTMTHMEGDFKDDVDEGLFDKHVAAIRYAMDLFDEYGAKLTIESGLTFSKANANWNENILKEVLSRGHGVGTHADFGAVKKAVSPTLYQKQFEESKALVDALVGAENNIGVSGGQGPGDWVLAASAAGFKFMDGVVGFAYLSMPLSERPEGYTDAAIWSTYYHDPAPVDLEQRTHPFWLKNAKDFTEDTDGVLLVNGGDVGELASIADGRQNCNPNCTLTQADVDALKADIDAALATHDGSRVGKINVHVPVALLDKKNETVLRSFLAMVKTYVDAGKLTFGTQKDVYDAVSM